MSDLSSISSTLQRVAEGLLDWLTRPAPGTAHMQPAFAFLAFLVVGIFTYIGSQLLAAYAYAHQPKPVPSTGDSPTLAGGTTIPIVWGTRRVRPITVWYPSELTEAIQIRTTIKLLFGMVKASAVTGYEYQVTLQQLICWGRTDTLVNLIFMNDRLLSDVNYSYDYVDDASGPIEVRFPLRALGNSTAVGPNVSSLDIFHGGVGLIDLFLPTIYGAQGGVRGKIRLLTGNLQYGPDPALVAARGARAPDYGEVVSLFFDKFVIGQSPTPPPIDVVVNRQPFDVNDAFGPSGCNARTYQGKYITPPLIVLRYDWTVTDTTDAIVLFDALTNQQYGRGWPATDFDIASFIGAHMTLQGENLGVSVLINGTAGKLGDFVEDREKTSGMKLRRDVLTAKWQVKLIRDEATTPEAYAALPTIDDTMLTSLDWSRPDPEDTINHVVVYFSNAERAFNRDFVELKNDANIAMTGSVRKLEVEYLSVTDRRVALRLCARDLKAGSIPLYKGSGKATRALWSLNIADCAKLVSRRHKVAGMVVRVLSVDLGDPSSNEIAIEVIEDVFQHGELIVSSDPGPGAPTPQPIILPRVTSVREFVEDGVDKLSFTLVDPQLRANQVAFRTQAGDDPLSDWVVVAESNFLQPTSLEGTYTSTVAQSAAASSQIAYRITYDLTKTLVDAFSFPLNPAAAVGGILTDDAGAVITDDAGNVLYAG